jgi:hypothetical protein
MHGLANGRMAEECGEQVAAKPVGRPKDVPG